MTRALVVGCADSVWNEVEAAQKLATFDAFYVVKMAGIHWDQGYFHWITLHPEYMARYRAERAKINLPDSFEIVGPLIDELGLHWEHPCDRRVSYRWPNMTSSGSSGLFAVKVALDDGHDRVVLAGVPMERDGNHFARGKTWTQRDCFADAWTQMASKIKPNVRSLSGWTQQLLGAPDTEWLSQAR